jgi:hypothetical protein
MKPRIQSRWLPALQVLPCVRAGGLKVTRSPPRLRHRYSSMTTFRSLRMTLMRPEARPAA